MDTSTLFPCPAFGSHAIDRGIRCIPIWGFDPDFVEVGLRPTGPTVPARGGSECLQPCALPSHASFKAKTTWRSLNGIAFTAKPQATAGPAHDGCRAGQSVPGTAPSAASRLASDRSSRLYDGHLVRRYTAECVVSRRAIGRATFGELRSPQVPAPAATDKMSVVQRKEPISARH